MMEAWKNWVINDLGMTLSQLELEHFQPVFKKCYFGVRKKENIAIGDFVLLMRTRIYHLMKFKNLQLPQFGKFCRLQSNKSFYNRHLPLIKELREIVPKYYTTE